MIDKIIDIIEQVIIGAICVGVLLLAMAVTGCHKPLLAQIEQDVATSTVEPLKSFRADTKHANDFLAANRKDGDYEN